MEIFPHDVNPNLSTNQKLVMEILDKERGPLSAYMILDELHGTGLRAPLQVYRALEKLIAIGKVHRLESLNAFIACGHMSCEKLGVTAFMICNKCENVQEVCDASVPKFLNELMEIASFKVSKSSIELHGICDVCENV